MKHPAGSTKFLMHNSSDAAYEHMNLEKRTPRHREIPMKSYLEKTVGLSFQDLCLDRCDSVSLGVSIQRS